MPKDLQVDKFWGFMERKKTTGEKFFSNLASCINEIAPEHTSLKRIKRKNLFQGAEDCNRKPNQFAIQHCVSAFQFKTKIVTAVQLALNLTK